MMKKEQILQKEKCSNDFLTRYLFEEQHEYKEKETAIIKSFDSTSQTINYKSIIDFGISCQNEEIIKIRDFYQNFNLNEIKKLPLVEPSQQIIMDYAKNKNDYESNLQKYYKVWNTKLRNVPNTNSMYLNIKKSQTNITLKNTLMLM